jgi:hypothetical protein
MTESSPKRFYFIKHVAYYGNLKISSLPNQYKNVKELQGWEK